MKIYSENPKDWKELQVKVGQILSEIGYECEIEKEIKTARETINVDVFALNIKENPQSKILCECKYWNTPIPKSVIHSFRTVVTDFGANYGLIISKIGFQSGSHEAVNNTNILLLNWDEFQDYFKINWIKSKTFSMSLETKDLYNYLSAGFLVYFKSQYNNLTETGLRKFNYLNSKYFNVAFYSSNLNYRDPNTNEFDFKLFEMYFEMAKEDFQRNFESYEEYYNYLSAQCKEGVSEFDNLFNEKLRHINYR